MTSELTNTLALLLAKATDAQSVSDLNDLYDRLTEINRISNLCRQHIADIQYQQDLQERPRTPANSRIPRVMRSADDLLSDL